MQDMASIWHDPCTPQAVTKPIHKFETEFTLHHKPKLGKSSTEQDQCETVKDSLKNTVNYLSMLKVHVRPQLVQHWKLAH